MVSNYWANKIMADVYTNSTHEFWLGISSTCPALSGVGVSEPTGAGYSRVQITRFSAPDNGSVYNMNALEFPESTDTWFSSTNKAKYWILFDGSDAAANVLAAGELNTPLIIETNTILSVDASELHVTLTDYTFG